MPQIFPNEAFPPDVTVQALDATIDVATGLPYVAKGVGPTSTPSYEVQYNRRQQRQNGVLAALRQGMVVDEGALAIGVYPLTYTLGSAVQSFAGATAQAVPDDSVRKVYLDGANALQIQAAFPTDATTYVPLATVTTAAGSMTIVDERAAVLFEVPAVGTAAKTIPFSPSIRLTGVLSVKVWEIEWVAPFDWTLLDATGRVSTAPTGSGLVVDVLVGGASIFSSDADRINIAAGGQQDTTATVNHAVTAGDVVTFSVLQVGSTVAGADMTIVLNGRASVQV